jgi:putative transposase
LPAGAQPALAPGSGLIAAACTALGLSRASLHRRQAFRRQPLAPNQTRWRRNLRFRGGRTSG